MTESDSAKFHSKIAKKYDKMYEDKYWEIHGRVEWSKLNKYLPAKKSRILDAGGGTGEFSIAFAEEGHYVTLTDISLGMIDFAKSKIKKKKLDDKIQVIHQDITNMKDLKTGSFDFVVSLGDPVSYCMNEAKAIKELSRVAKKNAYVIITVDSYFSQLLKLIKNQNDKELAKLEKSGKTNFPFDYAQHNFTVEELKKLFEKNNLQVIEIFGLLNFVNKIDKNILNKILSQTTKFQKILDLEIKYSNEPSLIGMASHLGIVGKKK